MGLEALAEARFERVVFTGGEVACRDSFVELAGLARTLDLKVGLITNGTAFARLPAAFWADDGVDWVVYSRDFATEARQRSFRRLRQSLGQTTQVLESPAFRSKTLQVNSVMFPEHLHEIEALSQHAIMRSASFWHIIPVKGDMAQAWSSSRMIQAKRSLDRIKALSWDGALGPFVVAPEVPFPTGETLASWQRADYMSPHANQCAACEVARTVVYFDSGGRILPCNCASWSSRVACFSQDVRGLTPASLATSLALRRNEFDHLDGRLICRSCDPLNHSLNMAHAGQ